MMIRTNFLSIFFGIFICLTISLSQAQTIKNKPITQIKPNIQNKELDTVPQVNCSYINKDLKIDPQINSIGVFDFSINTKFISKEKDLNTAKNILNSEGDSWGIPAFAFDNPNGGIIFGLWILQDDGDIVTAREIYKYLPPSFSEDWGIESDKIKYRVDVTPKFEISYVAIIASGTGDGKLFSTSNKKPTLGIWYHVPIFYKTNNKYKMGLIKLYSRSPVECIRESLNFLNEIFNSLEPKNVELVSENNFNQNLVKKSDNVQKNTTLSSAATSSASSTLKTQPELSEHNFESMNNKLDKIEKNIQDLKDQLKALLINQKN